MLPCYFWIEFLKKKDDNSFITYSLGVYYSVLMAPKLGEMDEVIKTIDLNSLPTNDNNQGRTLLVRASSFSPRVV